MSSVNPESPAAALASVAAALDAMRVPWFITGSLASGLYAIPRATNDIDLVIDLPPERAQELVDALGDAYYADAQMIASSFRRGQACNIMWLDTMMKVDLMPPRFAFDRSAMERRKAMELSDGGDGTLPVSVASAEDILLAKLWWYREGGEQSGRQWEDILNLIRFARGDLDQAYLDRWLHQTGLQPIWIRARAAAGSGKHGGDEHGPR